MDANKLKSAKSRVTAADQAFDRFKVAVTHGRKQLEWSNFINALGTAFNIVQSAAGGNKASKEWVSGKVLERKKDNLLQYLHQARHSEEHGIGESSSELLSLSAKINYAYPEIVITSGQLQLRGQFDPSTINAPGLHTGLVGVTNRGVYYETPTSHLGVDLFNRDEAKCRRGTDPNDVGELALIWFKRLIDEAEAYVINANR